MCLQGLSALQQRDMWDVETCRRFILSPVFSLSFFFSSGFPFWNKSSFSLAVRARLEDKGSRGRSCFWWASCQSKWSVVSPYVTSLRFQKWLQHAHCHTLPYSDGLRFDPPLSPFFMSHWLLEWEANSSLHCDITVLVNYWLTAAFFFIYLYCSLF